MNLIVKHVLTLILALNAKAIIICNQIKMSVKILVLMAIIKILHLGVVKNVIVIVHHVLVQMFIIVCLAKLDTIIHIMHAINAINIVINVLKQVRNLVKDVKWVIS